MAIYASDPHARPDSDFEPGTLRHLVPGNHGRLLDPRRTPVSVVEARPNVGFVLIRVEGFEDAGATWEVPLEQVSRYQFERGGGHASETDAAEMEEAIRRFAHEQVIEASEEACERTEARIAELQAQAWAWLARHSHFLAAGQALPDPATRVGHPLLAADLEAFTRERDLWDVELAFTRGYVSNPASGEVVKGHRIVLAELGLTGYAGPIVRDPATFAAAWTHERRAEHIIARLAFVRALFARMGVARVTLWRGLSARPPLRTREGRTLVSTTFHQAVARSLFESGARGSIRIMVRQDVPVERLLMTYLETAVFNDRFHEAEAVVLAQPRDGWP